VESVESQKQEATRSYDAGVQVRFFWVEKLLLLCSEKRRTGRATSNLSQ